MARKSLKFRLYPNRQQRARLLETLDLCRELYNGGLEERIGASKNRTPVNYHQQQNQLPEIKANRPEFYGVHSQVLQDPLRRLDKAFQAFFLRIKRGQKAGFPRFKSRDRYASFTYPQSGFALGGKLQLSKIGNLKIKQHRDIQGEIKTLTIRRAAGVLVRLLLGGVPTNTIASQQHQHRDRRGAGSICNLIGRHSY